MTEPFDTDQAVATETSDIEAANSVVDSVQVTEVARAKAVIDDRAEAARRRMQAAAVAALFVDSTMIVRNASGVAIGTTRVAVCEHCGAIVLPRLVAMQVHVKFHLGV